MELFDASGIDGSGNGATNLADALTGLAEPLNRIAENTNPLRELRPNKDLEDFMNLGDTPAKRATPLSAKIPQATRIATPVASPVGGGSVFGKSSQEMQSFTTLLTGAGEGIAVLGQSLAAIAAPVAVASAGLVAFGGAVAAAVATAHHFVQSFDPSTVMVFDAAMKDLNAVIGSMMVPILTEATRVVRLFSNSIFASADGIRSAVGVMARAFGDVFASAMPIVSSLASAMVPVAQFMADLSRSIADYLIPQFRAASTIISGLTATFKSVMKGFGGLFDWLPSAKRAGQEIAKLAVAISATAFALFGMNDALAGMIGALKDGADAAGRKDASGLAAATNARFTSISDAGKEVLQRAFIASGRSEKEGEDVSDAQFRKELVELVQRIKGINWDKEIMEYAMKIVRMLTTAPAKMMEELGQAAQEQGQGFARGFLNGMIPGRLF